MTIMHEIRAYSARTGVSLSEMGRAMAMDRNFVTKLVNGQLACTPERVGKVRQWMADNPDYQPAPSSPQDCEPSGSGVNVAVNPDLWEKDAEIGSRMLRDAMHAFFRRRLAA